MQDQHSTSKIMVSLLVQAHRPALVLWCRTIFAEVKCISVVAALCSISSHALELANPQITNVNVVTPGMSVYVPLDCCTSLQYSGALHLPRSQVPHEQGMTCPCPRPTTLP